MLRSLATLDDPSIAQSIRMAAIARFQIQRQPELMIVPSFRQRESLVRWFLVLHRGKTQELYAVLDDNPGILGTFLNFYLIGRSPS